jgi:hypothetical protein
MEQQSNITSQARIETNVYAEPRRDRLVYELFVKRTAEAIEERLVPALVDQLELMVDALPTAKQRTMIANMKSLVAELRSDGSPEASAAQRAVCCPGRCLLSRGVLSLNSEPATTRRQKPP